MDVLSDCRASSTPPSLAGDFVGRGFGPSREIFRPPGTSDDRRRGAEESGGEERYHRQIIWLNIVAQYISPFVIYLMCPLFLSRQLGLAKLASPLNL
jgi:hypothetical protein